MVSGSELIHRVTPRNSGAGAVLPGLRNCARDDPANAAAIHAVRPSGTIQREKRNLDIGRVLRGREPGSQRAPGAGSAVDVAGVEAGGVDRQGRSVAWWTTPVRLSWTNTAKRRF